MKIDYEEIFTNRTIYITGVGRSGTTIIGQILSSMRPAYYLFEPAILRAPLCYTLACFDLYDILRRNVFEDYFLPQIHGRCNPNSLDWTYWGNQFEPYEIEHRWGHLRRRDDALELIKQEKPLWVIKNPEAQPLASELGNVFPGIRFINVVRNGLDVISSSIGRGWFKSDYQPIEPTDKHGKPWYINNGEAESEDWQNWNQATRAACNWRILSDVLPGFTVKYEDFCQAPFFYIDCWAVEFELEKSHLTIMHGRKVKGWKHEPRPEITLADIQEPERSRFAKVMEKLKYKI